MASSNVIAKAGEWLTSQEPNDQKIISDRYITENPYEYRDNKFDKLFEWVSKKYADKIERWTKSQSNEKLVGLAFKLAKGEGGPAKGQGGASSPPNFNMAGSPVASASVEAGKDVKTIQTTVVIPANTSAVPPPVWGGQATQAFGGGLFGAGGGTLTPANAQLFPSLPGYGGMLSTAGAVPMAGGGMARPPAAPLPGAGLAGPNYRPPAQPGQPDFEGPLPQAYASPRHFTSDSERQERQQAEQANRQKEWKEDRAKEKELDLFNRKMQFGESGLAGKASMVLGGGTEGFGGALGALGKLLGPGGEFAVGVQVMEKTLSVANSFIDAKLKYMSAKGAGNPLEEAQARGAMLGQAPVIGGLLQGINELGTAGWKEHYAFRDMVSRLNETNMSFAKYSSAMSQVQGERMARDIELEQKRGERLAPSARILSETESQMKARNADWEDERTKKQNIDATKKMLEKEDRERRLEVLNLKDGKKDPKELFDALLGLGPESETLKDKIKELDEFQKTGKLPSWIADQSQAGTLGGWMQDAMNNDLAERNRPARF